MAEYIDRKALRDALYDADAITMNGVKILNQFPSADVAPVRHGKWIDRYDGKYANSLYECSECKCTAAYKFENDSLNIGLWVQDLSDYCQNCGAIMDLEK